MPDAPFVHLHCHTDYSLLDGACEISKLMDLVVEQKMPAVAMTDHGNLFGAVQFYNTATAKGVHPVIGCEVYVSQQGHHMRSESDRYNHLVLLCENQEGYRNLIDLVSTSFLEGFYYKPRIDKNLLASHSKGLIAMSACLRGDINETIMAERCQVKLEKIKEPFPRFEVPGEHSTDTYFEFVARQGFEKRRLRLETLHAAGKLRHDLAEYSQRLDREISMIQQMKFSGYFLIVWDFIRFAKSRSIPVGPGRGSAAGSLVSYAMEITDIDPLQYGLLFERFLNPERISMPDIDIDFCMNRRGEVIQYVTEKYGREQVAQIITFNTLAARAAIKDTGRVLDMSFADVERITKLVPNVLNIGLEDSFKAEPGFEEAARKDPRGREVMEVALRLEGLCRNATVHAAGVVTSPDQLKTR